ncbi:hypothetical protein FAEPRAM212_00143 [Faecalibacterium prausnitzii M21/2]|uniref:Uncharacterized protein n=1 Tax=Faecalibacterium prausnitzii M21/2 TaxID=411485 RepID=A8S6C1_9FIRM|nr:hypothetical protein FAEPRAM212_00143 [Faecalibacterium prausnitzii M21/2]
MLHGVSSLCGVAVFCRKNQKRGEGTSPVSPLGSGII